LIWSGGKRVLGSSPGTPTHAPSECGWHTTEMHAVIYSHQMQGEGFGTRARGVMAWPVTKPSDRVPESTSPKFEHHRGVVPQLRRHGFAMPPPVSRGARPRRRTQPSPGRDFEPVARSSASIRPRPCTTCRSTTCAYMLQGRHDARKQHGASWKAVRPETARHSIWLGCADTRQRDARRVPCPADQPRTGCVHSSAWIHWGCHVSAHSGSPSFSPRLCRPTIRERAARADLMVHRSGACPPKPLWPIRPGKWYVLA